MKATVIRTILAGLAGGLALALTNFLTFGLLDGSRRGQTGLLFDPATQSPKVIAVYKDIEPLPVIITRPYVILAGFVVFAIGHALLYRSVAAAWPARYGARRGGRSNTNPGRSRVAIGQSPAQHVPLPHARAGTPRFRAGDELPRH